MCSRLPLPLRHRHPLCLANQVFEPGCLLLGIKFKHFCIHVHIRGYMFEINSVEFSGFFLIAAFMQCWFLYTPINTHRFQIDKFCETLRRYSRRLRSCEWRERHAPIWRIYGCNSNHGRRGRVAGSFSRIQTVKFPEETGKSGKKDASPTTVFSPLSGEKTVVAGVSGVEEKNENIAPEEPKVKTRAKRKDPGTHKVASKTKNETVKNEDANPFTPSDAEARYCDKKVCCKGWVLRTIDFKKVIGQVISHI